MTEPPSFVDFETRSKAKLCDLGGRIYVEHWSTEVVCGVLRLPDGEDVLFSPFAIPGMWLNVGGVNGSPVLRGYTPPKLDTVIAHNGSDFDRHVWQKLGWPEPRRRVDTSYLMRVAGMPAASLEWGAENLLGRPKDLEGSALTKKLSAISTAKKNKGEFRTVLTPEVLGRVLSYCWLDVDLLPDLWHDWLEEWDGADLEGYEAAHLAMNDRGIEFDAELARDLLDADAILGEQACRDAGVAVTLVRSDKQMKAEMARRGCPVPNTQAETFTLMLSPEWVSKLGNEPVSKDVELLIRARLACKSIAAGKLRKALMRLSPDGRLRDNTRIQGAHTGRESGRGAQLQNLPGGPEKGIDIEGTLYLFDQGQMKAVYYV